MTDAPSAVTLRDVTTADLPAVCALNEQAVPHVNSIPLRQMAWFAALAAYFRVACIEDVLVGFLVGLAPGLAYESPNYRWFVDRYDRFLYVDRVVVAPGARRRGVAARLYRDLERVARGQAPRITCEVNLRPPNPGSLRFHEQMGFVQVGSQETEAGKKEVALLQKVVVP